jgi:hypothetical protein
MKRKLLSIVLILCVLGFVACQNIDFKKVNPLNLVKEKEKPDIKAVELEKLDTTMTQAIVAVFMSQMGELKSLPYVKVDSKAIINVDKQIDSSVFAPGFIMIKDYVENADGTITLDLLTGFFDRIGRRDMRMNHVVYRAENPDKKEAAGIEKWILRNEGGMFKENKEYKKILADFQREKGLKPDGIFGRISARKLSKDFSMIHIQKIESITFYPETPNHYVYIVPFKTVIKNPGKFSHGFDSLPSVGKHGITADKFKELAKPGEKFVLFVYFTDRIKPVSPIQVGFSKSGQGWSKKMSPKYYAVPGTWPVIAQTFCIDESLDTSEVYVNIFMKGKYTFKCIGNHRIKRCEGPQCEGSGFDS